MKINFRKYLEPVAIILVVLAVGGLFVLGIWGISKDVAASDREYERQNDFRDDCTEQGYEWKDGEGADTIFCIDRGVVIRRYEE